MSADNEKIIDIQFDNAPQTIDIDFDNNAKVLEADFGNIQQITVGNVSVSLEETSEGVVITAWDAEGEETALVRHGKDGKTPVKGEDYYTADDKAEMVTAVLAALPVYAGEVADA